MARMFLSFDEWLCRVASCLSVHKLRLEEQIRDKEYDWKFDYNVELWPEQAAAAYVQYNKSLN